MAMNDKQKQILNIVVNAVIAILGVIVGVQLPF